MTNSNAPSDAGGMVELAGRVLGRFRAFFVEQKPKREPEHVIDARAHPEQYFDCANCGDGPWHASWAGDDALSLIAAARHRGRKVRFIGPCCSGAD